MGKRLFVSVELDGLADDIGAVQDSFEGASGLRFTDPEQAHVTLKFLGDTDEAQIPELVDELDRAVAAADVDPFEAHVAGLGVFPSLEYISVVWVGFDGGTDGLTRLHESIEERTVAMGFDEEDHEFTPHATVARMDHAGGKELVQETVHDADPDIGRVQVDDVRLKESVLDGDGPVYSTIERFEL